MNIGNSSLAEQYGQGASIHLEFREWLVGLGRTHIGQLCKQGKGTQIPYRRECSEKRYLERYGLYSRSYFFFLIETCGLCVSAWSLPVLGVIEIWSVTAIVSINFTIFSVRTFETPKVLATFFAFGKGVRTVACLCILALFDFPATRV